MPPHRRAYIQIMRGWQSAILVCLFSAAIGCGGPSGSTTPTSPAAAACAFSAGAITVDAVGGVTSAAVPTAGACRWTAAPASPADAWIVIANPGVATGPGTLSMTIAPNRSFAGRTGTIVIRSESGQTLSSLPVTQRAAGCLYTVTPTEHIFTAYETYDGSGDSPFQVNVHAEPADCRWTASSTVRWLNMYATWSSPAQGTGDGRFYIVSQWNGDTVSRTGEIVVAGLSGVNPDARLLITQAGR